MTMDNSAFIDILSYSSSFSVSEPDRCHFAGSGFIHDVMIWIRLPNQIMEMLYRLKVFFPKLYFPKLYNYIIKLYFRKIKWNSRSF